MSLAALLEELLPPDWRRDLTVEPIEGGFRARFRDGEGRAHAIEVKRGADRCLLRGPALGYSYASSPHADVARFRALFERLAADESALLGCMEAPIAAEVVVHLRESKIRAPIEVPDRAHVYLYFEARCAQACQFCQEPAWREQPEDRRRHLALAGAHRAGTDFVGSGGLDALLNELGARGGALTIHGHDWAMHPRLEELLDRLVTEERVPISLLGPSTRLADPALAARVASIKTLKKLTLTLLAADPSRHDAIAGAPGSGDRVLAAIDALRAHGVEPIVNVVLTADVVEGLPALLALLDRRQLRAALLGFVPDRGPLALGHLFARASDIARALEGEVAARVVDSVAGLPLCALPSTLHSRASGAWPSTDRPQFDYARSCDTCSLRSRCAGVPPEYLARFGAEGLLAHPRAAGVDFGDP